LKARAAPYFGVVGLLLQAQARQVYGMPSEPGQLGRHNIPLRGYLQDPVPIALTDGQSHMDLAWSVRWTDGA